MRCVQTASVNRCTQFLEEVAVFEKTADEVQALLPNVKITISPVRFLDVGARVAYLADTCIQFEMVCLCVGAVPRLFALHPLVLGIRDLHSVQMLKGKLRSGSKVAIVGNGGIALELVHELTDWDLCWIIREDYVGSAFFDATVSEFILPILTERRRVDYPNDPRAEANAGARAPLQGEQITLAPPVGYGLGPEWALRTGLSRELKDLASAPRQGGGLSIHYSQQVVALSDDHGASWKPVAQDCEVGDVDAVALQREKHFPLLLQTSRGEIIGVDFAISATGVQADLSFLEDSSTAQPSLAGGKKEVQGLQLDEDGFVRVHSAASSHCMRTSLDYVYAAGDCCHYPTSSIDQFPVSNKDSMDEKSLLPAGSEEDQPIPFVSMKLWTHARLMGAVAAQSMCGELSNYGLTVQLELFAHITRFFGYKVVLLGRYNGQGLGAETERVLRTVRLGKQRTETESCPSSCQGTSSAATKPERENCPLQVLVRSTPGQEVVKIVLYRGRVVGALLIGETEMEEVLENLILNQLDVTALGIDLLDPDLDIGDYFD